ncbi:MAG: hypothetical protein AB7W06_00440 [Alphaproteobacteria bacterium]
MATVLLVMTGPLAHAGSLAWTVTRSSGATTWSATIADADIARIIAAYKTMNGMSGDTPDEQVMHKVIQDTLAQMLAAVHAEEQRQAAEAARAAVPMIVATPQQ